MDRKEWLAERQKGIGASDAAAAIDASPWKSSRTLAEEKRGTIEPDNLDDNEAVYWGNKLEPAIRDAVSERLGCPVQYDGEFFIRRHPDYPWMTATLDGRFLEPSKSIYDLFGEPIEPTPGTLQIKTANAWSLKDWNDEDWPLHYRVQCQHELVVTGYRWGILAVLVGGQSLRMLPFIRHDDFCEALIESLKNFWELVNSDRPIEADGSASTLATLKKLYPQDSGETVDLPAESLLWDAQRVAALKAKKEAELMLNDASAKLIDAIGTASVGRLPDGGEYTYRTQERAEHVVKASSFRVLRRKQRKGER